MPSKQELLDYLKSQPENLARREIARAYGLHGPDRKTLFALLRDLEDAGLIETRRRQRGAEGLPPVLVLEVVAVDDEGALVARPAKPEWAEQPPLPLHAPARLRPAPGLGDRVLVRLIAGPGGVTIAEAIRVLPAGPRRFLAVLQSSEAGLSLHPVDKRQRERPPVLARDAGGAQPGELVQAELLGDGRRRGDEKGRVVARIGQLDPTRSLSLIAIQQHQIPFGFAPDCLEEAAAVGPASPEGRLDLRHLPLVTIDGADARDFDDAVWAEPDPASPGGWHLLVAIADVAHYVAPGSALDRAASERGNSVYFPDQVVPMLPEALSNGWCSLKPEEDRAAVVAEMWLDAAGKRVKHQFHRAIIKSAARFTYEAIEAAHGGARDAVPDGLIETAVGPLYGAFAALLQARHARGTLELDLEEREVVLGADGRVAEIRARARLESHRLIEEFMIAANVAAAESLEAKRVPCLFRVHDRPDPEKLDGLRRALESFGFALPRGQVVRPESFNRLLARASGHEHQAAINELVLRSQSQAEYSPNNIGHFGLGLRRYTHFTSPIRRYADLLVHRALIEACALVPGPGKRGKAGPGEDLSAIGQHLSATERRAAMAERDTLDRFGAGYLASLGPGPYAGVIAGVGRAGLFVRLAGIGVDGLLPFSHLPDDRYDIDVAGQRILGRRWGHAYALGEPLRVRLETADPLSGGVILSLEEAAGKARQTGRRRGTASPRRRQ